MPTKNMLGQFTSPTKERSAVGSVLVAERQRRGWTGTRAALACGLPSQQYYGIERGKSPVGPTTAVKLGEGFGFSDEFCAILVGLGKIEEKLWSLLTEYHRFAGLVGLTMRRPQMAIPLQKDLTQKTVG